SARWCCSAPTAPRSAPRATARSGRWCRATTKVRGARTAAWRSSTDPGAMIPARVILVSGLLLFAAAARAQAPVTDGDPASLAGRMDRLERLLESRGLLDMLQQLEALQQQVSRLRGDMEMQMHALEQIRARQ